MNAAHKSNPDTSPDIFRTPQQRVHVEPQSGNYSERLNKLRAAVLGANDGIVSVAATVVGVAGASADRGALFLVAAAALSAGALSMALGEYVSVSSQKDSQKALIELESRELAEMPQEELAELEQILRDRGMSDDVARAAAADLTQHNALKAHLSFELGIDEDDIPSPIGAAIASALAFVTGAMLPILAILLPPAGVAIPITFAVVLIALAITGWLGAVLGGSPHRLRAAMRLVVGGALALAATFAIGSLLGTGAIG
ncbi:VIT1/CCC1 transporter family protein [Kocuria sp.]|uniref:VIT1/CCC1 transporter family protein n=1 Tax=Kocuria sp. TaxID=1871328 RepID=UPI0026E068AC|nr:VIT family protein [Kocuria sp.]MDO5617451.1 VIT family protein [Kocuria sp.]